MSPAAFWQGKRVFLTGHTGFKGAWLALWLTQLGAKVTGYALPPEETPDSLYSLLQLNQRVDSQYGDIGDLTKLQAAMQAARPEIIFHLAAQALVPPSYEAPLDTFYTNVMGTAHVLECARRAGSVRAIVNVTTDKCYENPEDARPLREDDPLGGYDPYSASKAAAEIISSAYRRSFLAVEGIQLATVRAGNVIGGGDFARMRLIPDIIRAALSREPVTLRHPESTRPWQHVLDVDYGYLLLAQALCERGEAVATAFNLGPDEFNIPVRVVAERMVAAMGNPIPVNITPAETAHEAKLLALDNARAKTLLGWQPGLSPMQAIDWSAEWYGEYLRDKHGVSAITERQLAAFEALIFSSPPAGEDGLP